MLARANSQPRLCVQLRPPFRNVERHSLDKKRRRAVVCAKLATSFDRHVREAAKGRAFAQKRLDIIVHGGARYRHTS